MKEFQIVDEFDDMEGVSEVFNEQWDLYLNDEVEKSTKNDLTTLGGASKANAEMSDDEPAQFDDNMESIMGRFNSFNSLMSSNNTDDNDDDKDDNDDDDRENPLDTDDFEAILTGHVSEPESVYKNVEQVMPLPENERMDTNFVDSNFWNKDNEVAEEDLDALLADFE